jgi:methylated-DNA-[protein]-cysteine S-methyltransferase
MAEVQMNAWSEVETIFGPALVAVDADGRLTRLHFLHEGEKAKSDGGGDSGRDDAAVAHVARELAEYGAGTRRAFDLELAPAGSPFQQKVWAALTQIPFGETESYGHLAARIGYPGKARAVGAANGANPIALIIPCHRVIGADGSLTGYGGGLPLKKRMLEFEGAHLGSRDGSGHGAQRSLFA